jgi:hypothetical protein
LRRSNRLGDYGNVLLLGHALESSQSAVQSPFSLVPTGPASREPWERGYG